MRGVLKILPSHHFTTQYSAIVKTRESLCFFSFSRCQVQIRRIVCILFFCCSLVRVCWWLVVWLVSHHEYLLSLYLIFRDRQRLGQSTSLTWHPPPLPISTGTLSLVMSDKRQYSFFSQTELLYFFTHQTVLTDCEKYPFPALPDICLFLKIHSKACKNLDSGEC